MNPQMAKQNAALYWLLAAVLYTTPGGLARWAWPLAAVIGLLEVIHIPWLAGPLLKLHHMATNRRARRHRPCYIIGGVQWWPVVITRAVQDQLWAVAPEHVWSQRPPEQMMAMLASMGQLANYEEKPAADVRAEAVQAVDALYAQLGVLLRDREGQPPSSEFLEEHLAVQRAGRLVSEISSLPMHAYEDA